MERKRNRNNADTKTKQSIAFAAREGLKGCWIKGVKKRTVLVLTQNRCDNCS